MLSACVDGKAELLLSPARAAARVLDAVLNLHPTSESTTCPDEPLQASLIHRSVLRHRACGLAEAILTNQTLPFQAVVLWLASSSPAWFVC